MTRAVYRYRDYTARPDEQTVPACWAQCVTGEEADCGTRSGDLADLDAVTRWMAEHTRDTGHETFDQLTRTTIRVKPADWH